jgi:hypothetical protein
MRKGFSPERYERRHDFPSVTSPRLSIDGAHWRSERSVAARAEVLPIKLARAG